MTEQRCFHPSFSRITPKQQKEQEIKTQSPYWLRAKNIVVWNHNIQKWERDGGMVRCSVDLWKARPDSPRVMSQRTEPRSSADSVLPGAGRPAHCARDGRERGTADRHHGEEVLTHLPFGNLFLRPDPPQTFSPALLTLPTQRYCFLHFTDVKPKAQTDEVVCPT